MGAELDVRWIPVRTAAQMLGVSRVRVYQMIGEQVLASIKVDCTVLVSRRSVESIAQEGRSKASG